MDRIPYFELVNSAMVGVFRNVLHLVIESGLHGEQQILVTFDTTHPDVKMSRSLLSEYYSEMTIVIQHEYWDLSVGSSGFSIGLSFENGYEVMYIPYSSLINVSDPSDGFELEFRSFPGKMSCISKNLNRMDGPDEPDDPDDDDDGLEIIEDDSLPSNVISIDFTRDKNKPK
jgi:hypothetical protein